MQDPQPELPDSRKQMTTDFTRAARYPAGPSKGRPNGQAPAPGVAEAFGRQGAPEQGPHPSPVPVPLSRAADEAALRRVARRRARMPVQRRDRVDVRYSAGEKAAILAKARSLNIAAAHYVGAVVTAHLDGNLNVALPGQRTPLDDLIDELAALRRELASIGNNANQIARKLNSGTPLHAGDLAALAHTERIQQSVAVSHPPRRAHRERGRTPQARLMIAKISSGKNTAGLIRYLYGPGRANEHTNPHLVASWDGYAPDPAHTTTPADAAATRKLLVADLDLHVNQARRHHRAPAQHVWHCSLRTAPGDRTLTDDEWAHIARRVVAATGIAPEGDPDGCRWIAVRHAPDHIHIAATTVRPDLRTARHWNDYLTADRELIAIEKEYGLQQVARGDRTAAKRPTRAEHEKAHRTGRDRTARETLRTTVAAATTTEEFISLLQHTDGVLVDVKHFPSGDVRGYTVALQGDTNGKQEPIWYSGSKLAPDLSLPNSPPSVKLSTPCPSSRPRAFGPSSAKPPRNSSEPPAPASRPNTSTLVPCAAPCGPWSVNPSPGTVPCWRCSWTPPSSSSSPPPAGTNSATTHSR